MLDISKQLKLNLEENEKKFLLPVIFVSLFLTSCYNSKIPFTYDLKSKLDSHHLDVKKSAILQFWKNRYQKGCATRRSQGPEWRG